MRVLHLTAGNLFGGIETYLLTLARLRHLCPEMEPHFGLCFPGRLRDELVAAGVAVHDLGGIRASRPWTVLRGRARLRQVLRETQYSSVVSHGTWPHAVFAPVVRQAGSRLVNLVHGELGGRHWIDRWAARTPPDMVVANSHHTAGFAESVFPRIPLKVVYYPVAATETGRSSRADIRASLETPDSAVVILQASRLERWKGQAVHISALAELATIPGWIAWIAGGPQKADEGKFLIELKAAAVKTGIANRVRFLGQREDVPRLMGAADIYCQPNSGPEPFGIAFIEALSAGLPVVTSRFGGAMEVLNDECGVLCPPGDARALANALSGLIIDSDRRRVLGEAGPGRVVELCDPTRQMAALATAISPVPSLKPVPIA